MVSKKRKLVVSITLSNLEMEYLKSTAARSHESCASFSRRIIMIECEKVLAQLKENA